MRETDLCSLTGSTAVCQTAATNFSLGVLGATLVLLGNSVLAVEITAVCYSTTKVSDLFVSLQEMCACSEMR